MRTRFPGGGHDCFHFNSTAYDVLIENLIVDYADSRFSPGLTLQFDNLQAEYSGQLQTVPVSTIPPEQELIVSYDNSLDEPVDVGSYNVVVTAPGWREDLQGVFEIVPGAQSIDFPQPGPVFVNQGDIELGASASSGLPVDYALLSGPAVLNGNILTLTGSAGTLVVEANQSGNGNWQAADSVERSIEVMEATDELFDDRFEPLL